MHFGNTVFLEKVSCLVASPTQLPFLTISNDFFFKTWVTILVVIATPKKGLEYWSYRVCYPASLPVTSLNWVDATRVYHIYVRPLCSECSMILWFFYLLMSAKLPISILEILPIFIMENSETCSQHQLIDTIAGKWSSWKRSFV